MVEARSTTSAAGAKMISTRRETIAGLGTLLVVGTRAEAAPSLSTSFEGGQISAGENRPGLPMGSTNDALLAFYHLRLPPDQIAGKLKLPSAEVERRTNALVQEGLARRLPNGQAHPTALVVTRAEQPRFLYAQHSVVRAAADAIGTILPAVRRRYATLPGFAHVPFADASLLVLSDGLLDNWQINRVEEGYLKVLRPQRGGGRYYYAVFETRPGDPVESFGIYGNHGQGVGDTTLSLYGNQRYSGPTNLVTLEPGDLTSRFGFPPGTVVQAAQKELVADLLQRWRDPSAPVNKARAAGLRSLGLLAANGRTAIPVLGPADDAGLDAMAAAFAPSLLAILEKHRSALEAQYRNSPYAAEGVSFPEYFIWWYHVFYTDVTNELAHRRMIVMPRNGTLTYLVTS